jgi:hypothetical protein
VYFGHTSLHHIIYYTDQADASREFIWGPISALEQYADLGALRVNDTVTVNNLKGSGLSDCADSKKLYVRQACLDLWEHLTTTTKRVSLITGCYGVGKSVAVFAYAMRQASTHKKRLIYAHTHGAGVSLVSTAGDTVRFGQIKKKRGEAEPESLMTYIEWALDRKEVDLIVLDGQLLWSVESLLSILKRYPNVRLITCTSYQPVSLSLEQFDRSPRYSQHLMDSWTKEEYEAAIAAGALTLFSPSYTVDQVYHYAGGSIAFMRREIEHLVTYLTGIFYEVEMMDLVGKTRVGDRSKNALNTLMAFHGGSSVISSEFAIASLLMTMKNSRISEIRWMLCYNPSSWQGLVTKLDVLTLIQDQSSIAFRNSNGRIENWPRPHDRYGGVPLSLICDANDKYLTYDTVDDWVVPTEYTHGCFDALYRVSPGVIRAIKITEEKEHPCNLGHLIDYVKALNAHVVELVYVCRRSNFDDFKTPRPDTLKRATGTDDMAAADAIAEHEQYKKLMQTLEAIWTAKTATTDPALLPKYSIVIRSVCYEEKDQDLPLKVTVDPL